MDIGLPTPPPIHPPLDIISRWFIYIISNNYFLTFDYIPFLLWFCYAIANEINKFNMYRKYNYTSHYFILGRVTHPKSVVKKSIDDRIDEAVWHRQPVQSHVDNNEHCFVHAVQ